MKRTIFWILLLLISITLLVSVILWTLKIKNEEAQPNSNVTTTTKEEINSFKFYVLSDQREFAGEGEYDNDDYFKGVINKINELGKDEFIVIPGDLDPVSSTQWTIENYLGEDYIWYPIVGNHELPAAGNETYLAENLQTLRNFDIGKVKKGPRPCDTTTYSFNFGNTHFVILNEYCDIKSDYTTDGDIPDLLFNWLKEDLEKTSAENILVFGHEPAYPQPDAESERLRHEEDSLNIHPENRDRFWDLLTQNDVEAYFCGHTHNYSKYQFKDLWQIDAGHARGIADLDSKSTFLQVEVNGDEINVVVYRLNNQEYSIFESFNLD